MAPLRCLVLGAAGRDFHDFLTFLRRRPELRVVGFTAQQIPFIAARRFPAALAGEGYLEDLPIYPEEQLEELVQREAVDLVVLAYSDLSHAEVMHLASRALAAGASFTMLGPKHTELRTKLPVVSVTAVRTGAGKSPLSQAIAAHLRGAGLRVGVLRHPMPYGDLAAQAIQRFATPSDLDRADCTVEEREEYAPYVDRGTTVWAGVDYERILRAAEAESDVIVWDGGNNDRSFLAGGLRICVADALRAGHEESYHPGEANFRMADVIVLNKVSGARREDVAALRASAARLNPRAELVEADLEVALDHPERVRGKRVLVLEDGPTLTHGGMPHGAGLVAARAAGAAELVDPRPYATGSVKAALAAHPHLGSVLPALGYSAEQRAELAATLRAAAPDAIVDASPAGIASTLTPELPVARARYAFVQRTGASLLERALRHARAGDPPT
ncbi:MAG: GTPase [Deltaproteobacteria bacterium]|nr:GTPase [Deltaproteobacteria bacterium]